MERPHIHYRKQNLKQKIGLILRAKNVLKQRCLLNYITLTFTAI